MRDPSDAEDTEKIREFLAGDARAFDFLYEKYRERVYRLAYRFLHDREDALEVTQDVFLRVYLGLSRFKTQSKFFTWLYRVAVNRAIDFARAKRGPRPKGVEDEVLEVSGRPLPGRRPAQDPVEVAAERELAEAVRQAVAGLSEKHRTVFLLHATENLSYREIAEVVGCNLGTVMSRLFYARKKLQRALGKKLADGA